MDEEEVPAMDDFPDTHPHFHADKELEDAIRELMRNSREDYSQVSVSVEKRDVKFSGTIDNEEARYHLDELAQMVAGTGSVTNEVVLKH
jgi:osmotically-inducible protein OsmY